jgi:sterol desaturase/sphingolipid hydroxylase (fatty acid hydroxylase superfamily)
MVDVPFPDSDQRTADRWCIRVPVAVDAPEGCGRCAEDGAADLFTVQPAGSHDRHRADPAADAASGGVPAGLSHVGGIGVVRRPLAQWHAAIVIPLALFMGDLVAYFRHRFEHSRLLWPSHVMHHSDQDMNWTTVYRFHPINRLTTIVIDYGSLILFGFPPYAVAINGLVRSYYGMFIHTRLPWTLGWLGHVLVSPAMHRWHHVLEGQGVGSNFASIFSVFDRLFGTHYVPGPCNSKLGVQDVDNDALLTQLALPVTRAAAFITNMTLPRKRPATTDQP